MRSCTTVPADGSIWRKMKASQAVCTPNQVDVGAIFEFYLQAGSKDKPGTLSTDGRAGRAQTCWGTY